MSSHDVTTLFLGLAMLLGAAHAFGELARRIGQPVVVGEMLAGLLLGPTCLGAAAPALQRRLFPTEGPAAIALDAVVALAVALVLLIAGLEVDLSSAARQANTRCSGTSAGAFQNAMMASPMYLSIVPRCSTIGSDMRRL